MSEPQVNVDHFSHRPVYTVVGLLTGSAGVDVAAVEILCGEQGARIRIRTAAVTGCEP